MTAVAAARTALVRGDLQPSYPGLDWCCRHCLPPREPGPPGNGCSICTR